MIFYSTMISLNTKRYLLLLWGISILFFMESKSASIPETSNISSTVEPNMTTKQLSTVHVHHSETETQPATQDLTRSAAEVSVAAETTVSATVETKEALSNISGSSTVGLVVMNTEAATISNSGPQVPGGSIDAPAVTTAASKEQAPHNKERLRNNLFLRSNLTDLPQSQTTSTGMNVSAAAPSTAPVTVSGPQVPGGSTDAPAVTTAANKEQPSHNTTISETAKLTDLPQSQTTSTGMNVSAAAPSTAPVTVSEISSVTVAVSSSMSTYINELHVTTKSYSTNSSDDSTQAARNFSSPSNLSTTATTTNTSSEASEVLTPNSTASPTRISEISAVSTELSSVSQPVSATRSLISASHVPDTARPSSTTESPTHSISTDPAKSTADSPTPSISTDPAKSTAESPTPSFTTDPANSTAVSTSLVGVLNPRVPKKLPIPTTKSTPATTTAAHEVSKCPPITEVKPCSSRKVMNICLITIASLALLATIFMVSTIVLCVKLSARKYKVRKPHHETEMMCISTLLPDRTNNYIRQRNPITNGVLVIPNGRDYDEDGGDDVTLSSFLPDNDRYI